MAAGKWLDEIRARVAARGVPVADLARAAGMERSNLRRLLSSTGATPRLGTVMRVLAPLDSWVMPPGARTASELMAFLDSERDRRGASWEVLLTGSRFAAATFAERLRESPERLPLDVVLHIADGLEIELKLAETHDPPAASHDDESRRRPRRRGGSRSPRAKSRPAVPRPPESRGAAPANPTPRPADAAPSPREPSSASSPWRLCPPRLGRYRDAPPLTATPRARAVVPYVPPEPKYELEHAILRKLAEFSRDEWRDVYVGLHETITGAMDVPLDFFDGLAARTERWFRRLRPARSDPGPEPRVEVPCEDVDPSPFIDAWRAMMSNPDRRTTEAFHDAAGRANVAHPAVSGTHYAVVQLGQGGRPHRLVMITEVTPDGLQPIAKVDIRLELKIGSVHPFAHVHAGPVFGALQVGDRIYMLGAMSSMLALVEVTRTGARALWVGFAEALEEKPLEVPPIPAADATTGETLAGEAPVPTIGAHGNEPDRRDRDDPQRAELEAELAAVRRELAEERAHRAESTRQADEARDALASSERARLALQQQFGVELAAVRRALEEAHAHRAGAQQRADEAESASASSEYERLTLQRQLEAERTARIEDEQLVRASAGEFLRILFSMHVELTETRRRLRAAEAFRGAPQPATGAGGDERSARHQRLVDPSPGDAAPLEAAAAEQAEVTTDEELRVVPGVTVERAEVDVSLGAEIGVVQSPVEEPGAAGERAEVGLGRHDVVAVQAEAADARPVEEPSAVVGLAAGRENAEPRQQGGVRDEPLGLCSGERIERDPGRLAEPTPVAEPGVVRMGGEPIEAPGVVESQVKELVVETAAAPVSADEPTPSAEITAPGFVWLNTAVPLGASARCNGPARHRAPRRRPLFVPENSVVMHTEGWAAAPASLADEPVLTTRLTAAQDLTPQITTDGTCAVAITTETLVTMQDPLLAVDVNAGVDAGGVAGVSETRERAERSVVHVHDQEVDPPGTMEAAGAPEEAIGNDSDPARPDEDLGEVAAPSEESICNEADPPPRERLEDTPHTNTAGAIAGEPSSGATVPGPLMEFVAPTSADLPAVSPTSPMEQLLLFQRTLTTWASAGPRDPALLAALHKFIEAVLAEHADEIERADPGFQSLVRQVRDTAAQLVAPNGGDEFVLRDHADASDHSASSFVSSATASAIGDSARDHPARDASAGDQRATPGRPPDAGGGDAALLDSFASEVEAGLDQLLEDIDGAKRADPKRKPRSSKHFSKLGRKRG